MKLPKKLNGYPVIAIAYRGAGSYFVMVHREGASDPFVWATWAGGPDWFWGHYHQTLTEALDASPDIGWLHRDTLKPMKGTAA